MCFLCKSNKRYDFLRSFVYDLIVMGKHTMPLLFQNLVLQCVRIWPEPFNWPCYLATTIGSTQSNDFELNARLNPVLSAIIFVIRDSFVKNNAKIDAQSNSSHASSSSNMIVNYSEYSAYYIYVSIQISLFVCLFVCMFLFNFSLIKQQQNKFATELDNRNALRLGIGFHVERPAMLKFWRKSCYRQHAYFHKWFIYFNW